MRKMLEGSLLYRWLSAAARWLDRQWEKSFLAAALTGGGCKTSDSGVCGRVLAFLRRLLCGIFEKLRLTRLLEGSVFRRMFLWCALAVAVAPVMPTMVTVGFTLLGLASVLISYGCDRSLRMRTAPVNKWALLFSAVYLCATLTSVSLEGSIRGGLLTVFLVLFTLALQASVTERHQIDTLFFVMTGTGLVVSLYGFVQVFTGAESTGAWIDSSSFADVELRVFSFLENPNVLAEYLLLTIPVGAACAVTAESKPGRWFAIASTAAMTVCMVLTLSRGGWLGLLLAAALFLVLLDRRFVVLGVLALLAVIPFLPETVIDRFASITDLSDSSTSYRIYIWMATLDMLRDYWICGIGTGYAAFVVVYPHYSYNAIVAPHSHNLYLQMVVECGILGLVVLLGTIGSFLRMTGSALKRSRDNKTRIQLIALISGFSGFLLQSVTDFSFYNYRVLMMFWVIVSVGAMLARNWEEKEETA